MKKIVWFLGLSICLLALGTLIVSCGTSEEGDTWSDINSIDQLNGKWKGAYTQSMTMKEAMGEEWDEAFYGDMKVTTSVEMTFVINASEKTQSTFMKITMAYSGENINTLWAILSIAFLDNPDAVLDNEKHSITITMDGPEQPIADEDIEEILASGLQINQSGTRIKMPAGLLEDGSPELIFKKQ
ncbi:MAG: hypothetical protein LBI04_04715 [Treponema sp.]|jgi:hypothetical protein|nr:hypothetical protein [Treponema sp.]